MLTFVKALTCIHNPHLDFKNKSNLESVTTRILKLKDNYPMVEYLDSPIIKDTKNILYQNFVEKYCKLMQDILTNL